MVLLFYEESGILISNIQLKSPWDRLTDFQKENARIVAVSTDTAVFIIRPDGTVAYDSLQSGPLDRPNNNDLLRIVSR